MTSALVMTAVMPYGALAQDPAQQLPPDFAQQQVPPAFPDVNAAAVQQAPAETPSQAQQTRPSVATATETPAAGQQAPQAIDQVQAQQPGQIPEQPGEQKLVPSTPMGAAAQQADNGQGGTPAPAQAGGAAAENPVEAAAEAVDEQQAMDDAPENMPQPVDSTASILDQYAAKAEAAAADREMQENANAADALPTVDNLNMVKLEGDFSNSVKKVNVPVDGSLETGKTSEELKEEIRTEAFDAAITGMFPLSPDQIQNLLKRYDTTQEAVESPPYDAPRAEISVQNISLDPGVAPPVVKTAVGNVTTINILDATGAPWPVQDVTWAGDYEVVEPEEGGHIIRITPMSHFARGNIVIRMLTLKTPLTMTLETGRDVVQYRVDARIPEYGPFATAPIMQGGKSLVAGSPDLTSILDGVMPNGMTKLQVAGVDGRTTAYVMGGTTYIRTPLTLLSPAWQSSVSSADGMNVYALSSAPVVLLSDGGEFMRATISEKEDLLDE